MDDLHAEGVLEQIRDELRLLRATIVELQTTLARERSFPVAPSSGEETEMLDAKAVAALLGLHPNWVYAEAKAGRLPSYKLGGVRRFRRSEINDCLARHYRQPTSDD